MWGKLLAAGQTCVAPDYLLVHRDLKEGLCREMKHAVGEFFGDYPLRSPAYPRIVSERATARLAGMIGASGRVLWGGEFDVRQRYVAPTLIDDPGRRQPGNDGGDLRSATAGQDISAYRRGDRLCESP